MQFIGGRWVLPVLRELSDHPVRLFGGGFEVRPDVAAGDGNGATESLGGGGSLGYGS